MNENNQCSRGWANRCPRAKSKKCTCACGGANHGTGLTESDKAPAEPGKEGYVTGRYPSRRVFIGANELRPGESQKIVNHSPNGFNWGYGGSGPAQLALAILTEIKGKEYAVAHYQKFKFDVIATLEQGKDFELPMVAVEEWVANHTEANNHV